MTKKRDAWMPLYIGDWDLATGHLTNEQDGAYGRLIRWYWRNGPIPDDDVVLGNIIRDPKRWKTIRFSLAPFFIIRDGFWHNKRADEEREKAQNYIDSRRLNGLKGGRPKAPDRNLDETICFDDGNHMHNHSETPAGEGEGSPREVSNLSEGTSRESLALIVGGRP